MCMQARKQAQDGLKDKVDQWLLRRTKRKVWAGGALPPKIDLVVWLQPTPLQQRIYEVSATACAGFVV